MYDRACPHSHMMLRRHSNPLSGGIAWESVHFKHNESELLLNAVVSCYYSLDCMPGVASKYTVDFLLSTRTRK